MSKLSVEEALVNKIQSEILNLMRESIVDLQYSHVCTEGQILQNMAYSNVINLIDNQLQAM